MYSACLPADGENCTILNQLVVLLGPLSVANAYFIICAPFEVSENSGSVPMRPTMVIRASCDDLDVENARVQVAAGVLRTNDVRNDIVVSYVGIIF